jgi:DNA-binding GntR family transcriptional regulator
MTMDSNGSGRLSKQESTYRVLRGRIVDGSYGPGHRIVIDAVARELEVSQMPVREALRRLEAEGWIVYQQNQGAQVAPLDADLWSEVMSTLAILEGFATAQAAPYLRAADITRMRAINRRMRQALDALDLARISEHNHAFHATIHARCQNDYLQRQLRVAAERLDSLRRTTIFMYIPMRGRVSADEHDQLVELITVGASSDQIERFAREHKLHTVAAYEQRRREVGA